MSEFVLAWFVLCSTLALLCALSICSAPMTLSVAAVLTATSNQWNLSLSERNAACAAVGCHASSILRIGSVASWSRTYYVEIIILYATRARFKPFRIT